MPQPLSEVLPETKVSPDLTLENRTRRLFIAEYKPNIIDDQADACAHGKFGPLLLREGLYSAQLKQWRDERGGPLSLNSPRIT